jgi:protein tyrosine phosphatase (PTP) superfamily phosphohydrolase (DUF442 family)
MAIAGALLASALLPAGATTAHAQRTPRGFQEVVPGVFRSAQPSSGDLREIRERGVRTVLVLRSAIPEAEQVAAARVGLELVHVPMDGTKIPSIEEVDRALAVILEPSKRPVLVHCAHGEERTGAVIAAYRVVAQGWDPAAAEAEALELGFGFDDLGDFLAGYRDHWRRQRAGRGDAEHGAGPAEETRE